MDDSKWERWSALGGVLFVIMILVGAFLPGSPPKTSDSASKIAKFIADKPDELRWAGFIGALATRGPPVVPRRGVAGPAASRRRRARA